MNLDPSGDENLKLLNPILQVNCSGRGGSGGAGGNTIPRVGSKVSNHLPVIETWGIFHHANWLREEIGVNRDRAKDSPLCGNQHRCRHHRDLCSNRRPCLRWLKHEARVKKSSMIALVLLLDSCPTKTLLCQEFTFIYEIIKLMLSNRSSLIWIQLDIIQTVPNQLKWIIMNWLKHLTWCILLDRLWLMVNWINYELNRTKFTQIEQSWTRVESSSWKLGGRRMNNRHLIRSCGTNRAAHRRAWLLPANEKSDSPATELTEKHQTCVNQRVIESRPFEQIGKCGWERRGPLSSVIE